MRTNSISRYNMRGRVSCDPLMRPLFEIFFCAKLRERNLSWIPTGVTSLLIIHKDLKIDRMYQGMHDISQPADLFSTVTRHYGGNQGSFPYTHFSSYLLFSLFFHFHFRSNDYCLLLTVTSTSYRHFPHISLQRSMYLLPYPRQSNIERLTHD